MGGLFLLVKGSSGAVLAEWNAATSADLRPATGLQRNHEVEKDLTPRFEDRPISKITRIELTTAPKEVETRAPEVARNLRIYLWGIFECAIDSGHIEDYPVPPVRVLRKRNQVNHRALSPELLGEFLRQLDAFDTIHAQTRIAMLLVVLTACRKAGVIGGKWREIDLEAAEWEIPAERMKAGGAQRVPLSRQAVKLIKELRALAVMRPGVRGPHPQPGEVAMDPVLRPAGVDYLRKIDSACAVAAVRRGCVKTPRTRAAIAQVVATRLRRTATCT